MIEINVLLFGMIIIYLLIIKCIIENNYKSSISISNILEKCYSNILFLMFLMGILTIFYEGFLIYYKKTILSFILIILLLLGIYGLIIFDINYNIHYLFTLIVFIIILLYMICNCYIYKCYKLNILLFIQIIISIFLIIYLLLDKEILLQEIFLLIIFAIYYFVIHYKICINYNNYYF
jgi:hypothetical protein